jgi:hypothetical protein
MAALPEDLRRGVKLSGREHPTQASLVEESQSHVLRLAVAARNAFVQIRQSPGRFFDRPGSQMLPEPMESEFGIYHPDEEVQEPIRIPLGAKSTTRSPVNPERRFESWPDGHVHGRY